MNKQEAITLLKKLRTYHNGTYAISIDMAIEALESRTTKHARGGWHRVGKVYVRRQK